MTRSGLLGPWDKPEIGPVPAGVNPGDVQPWGITNFQIFPNLEILIYERGWYLSYTYWPTSHNTHRFVGDLYYVPAKTVRERVAQEISSITFKEYALQDAGTLEGTQSMLESRVLSEYPMCDQEFLVRHFHKVVADWVDDYARELAAV